MVTKHGHNQYGRIQGLVREWNPDKKKKKESNYNNLGTEVYSQETTWNFDTTSTLEFDYYDKTSYENMVSCIGNYFLYDGQLRTYFPDLSQAATPHTHYVRDYENVFY
jgi:hypothetical protein